MRLVLLSDTHCYNGQIKVPDGDVLVHAGDLTLDGSMIETAQAAQWLADQPHKYKVATAGNHDWLFLRQPKLARDLMLRAGVIYLQDMATEIDGLKFYGAPWQPEFGGWAFNLPREGPELGYAWALIPSGLDVLITHGPPLGVLDTTHYGADHLGDRELALAVREKRPRLHVFGHIHGGYGVVHGSNTMSINAAVCDEAYRPVHEPWVVDMEPGYSWPKPVIVKEV